MKASEHNNMKAHKSPSISARHVGDFQYDRYPNDVKSPTPKYRDHSNLVTAHEDGGDFTDMYSTCSKVSNSNPFYLNQQKRSLGRKPSKLSKARKRSTMSVIKETNRDLHCGDYFRGAPPRMLPDGDQKRNLSRVPFDSRFHPAPPFTLPRSSVEDIKDRSGPSLETLGICKADLDVRSVCAPPKKRIHDALYKRVANFINPDISVYIDSHEFLCHRIVLQCYSEYFEQVKDHTEVVVENVTKGAFIAIYNWMLAPEDEGVRYIEKNNILEMLIASKILVIKELENQCLAFIDSKEAFSEENAYLLFVDASRRQQTEIMELMVPRIQAFFLVLVSTIEFTELEVDDLCTLLQSNYIVVHCEMEIFMAAVKWLMAKWEERSKVLPVVMKCIRFGLMTPAQLIDIRKNPMSPEFIEITNDKTVQMLIEDGLAYSVESGITGQKDIHHQRCELLNLKIPEPRNWAKETKEYKSYGDFLKYLSEITKNPQAFYSDIRRECANNDGPFANEGASSSSSSDESFDSRILASSKAPINPGAKKPSLSDLLCKEKSKPNVKHLSDERSRPRVPEHDLWEQKYHAKPGKVPHEKTLVEDGKFDQKPPARTSKGLTSQLKERGRPSPKRMSLAECAAIVIQATYRGYRVRKALRLQESRPEWNSEPSKKLALDDIFLRVKSTSDWDRALSDGNYAPVPRSGGKLKTKTTLTRSSSNESNESIISVREGPAYRRKPSGEKAILLFGGINPSVPITSAGNQALMVRDASQVYKFSLETNTWDKVDTMPSPRYYHSSAVLGGKVYIIGGCNPGAVAEESAISAESFSYDLSSGVWSKEAELNTPRKNCGLVALNNNLYAVGGQGLGDQGDNALASVERYDVQLGSWEEVALLPKPTVGGGICVFQNLIWLVGGMSGTPDNFTISRDVWCYDPRRDIWMKKPPLRFARAFAALETYDDNLYLVGGLASQNGGLVSNDHIDVWDGEDMMWKLKGHMNFPRHGHSIAFLGPVMLLFGGAASRSPLGVTRVDALDMLSSSKSRRVAPLPSPLIGHSFVCAPLND